MATSLELQPVSETVEAPPARKAASRETHKSVALAFKRVIDVCGSLLLLILVAPCFPLIALAIRLGSKGPIFFRPRIIGYKEREFLAYKFRTMHSEAFERLLQDPNLLRQYKKNLKLTNDPRVTRVGRWLRRTSIDELPQLINVLKGEMSLVGPRMLAALELEKFAEHRDRILSVRPGMAGLWVASGRQTVSFERRVELELRYIEQWSLWLDAKCFFQSVAIALRMVGAH